MVHLNVFRKFGIAQERRPGSMLYWDQGIVQGLQSECNSFSNDIISFLIRLWQSYSKSYRVLIKIRNQNWFRTTYLEIRYCNRIEREKVKFLDIWSNKGMYFSGYITHSPNCILCYILNWSYLITCIKARMPYSQL